MGGMTSEREHFKVDSTVLEEGDAGQLLEGMSSACSNRDSTPTGLLAC